MIIKSESDLLRAFRPKDQKSVLPPAQAPYPLEARYYYTWSEPSGVYQYLVFQNEGWESPLGLVFQRNGLGSHSSPAGMCDWCHSYGASDEIGLLTTVLSSRKVGGTYLCLDLSCINKLEAQAALTHKSPEQLAQKLLKRIAAFYEKTIWSQQDSDQSL